MTDQPSEAALRKACEVLGCNYPLNKQDMSVIRLARHFDAEDKAAREAFARCIPGGSSAPFIRRHIRRHILPDPKPTVADVVERWRDTPGRTTEALASMLRDAGLLREGG